MKGITRVLVCKYYANGTTVVLVPGSRNFFKFAFFYDRHGKTLPSQSTSTVNQEKETLTLNNNNVFTYVSFSLRNILWALFYSWSSLFAIEQTIPKCVKTTTSFTVPYGGTMRNITFHKCTYRTYVRTYVAFFFFSKKEFVFIMFSILSHISHDSQYLCQKFAYSNLHSNFLHGFGIFNPYIGMILLFVKNQMFIILP